MMDNIDLLVSDPSILLQLLLDGLLIGSVFALAAYGMAMVWGVMNIVNVAQGEFVILGGYITYYLWREIGMYPFLATLLAAIVLFVVGWVLYRLVIARVVDRDVFTSVLATFGISIVLQQLMNEGFGADYVNLDTGMTILSLFGGEIDLALIKVVSFVVSLIAGGVLAVFLRQGRLGQAIRATAQHSRAARVQGIDTGKVYAMTYGLNCSLCAVTGALVVMIWTIHPFAGLSYTVRSFLIVVVAGVGNLAGVVVSGLGLGAAEQTAGFVFGSEFQLAFIFVLLVTVLVVRNARLQRRREHLQ